MKKEVVLTAKAPSPVGAYSQAIKADKFLFVSGQIPINPETGTMDNASFENEVRRCLTNLKAIIEDGGSSIQNTVKVNIFIKDMNNFPKLNTIYSEFFKEPFPARAVVEVSRLPKDVNIEIEAVALLH